MYGDKRFNIRVYGIWIRDGKLLVNEELIKGQKVTKLIGGGLEYGEGIADCLVREWKEEIDIDIQIKSHFYTTDFFQPSAFDNTQVISIYYLIDANYNGEITNANEHERTYWLSLKNVSADTFTLPIDRKVGDMLRSKHYTQL